MLQGTSDANHNGNRLLREDLPPRNPLKKARWLRGLRYRYLLWAEQNRGDALISARRMMENERTHRVPALGRVATGDQ
jgi:hypothetical protein